jgi:hypothetical protein
MSWDMDVIMPNKFDVRADNNDTTKGKGAQSPNVGAARVIDSSPVGYQQAIRGERGGWANN